MINVAAAKKVEALRGSRSEQATRKSGSDNKSFSYVEAMNTVKTYDKKRSQQVSEFH